MEQKVIQLLKNLWLNEKEAKIWLTTLKIWPKPASEIAKNLLFERTSTYRILQRLEKLWLVNSQIINWIQHFYIESENILQKILTDKINSLQNFLSEIENISIFLKQIKSPFKKLLPITSVYDSVWWIEKIYLEIRQKLKNITDIKIITWNLLETLPYTNEDLNKILTNLEKKLIETKKISTIISIQWTNRFESIYFASNPQKVKSLNFSSNIINTIIIDDIIYIISLQDYPFCIKIDHPFVVKFLSFALTYQKDNS